MTSTDKDTVVDMKTESYYKLHSSLQRLLGVIPQLQPRGTYVGGQIVGCLWFDLRNNELSRAESLVVGDLTRGAHVWLDSSIKII